MDHDDSSEDVEELVSDVGNEYDVSFNDSTERAAEFGSLMVSLRMVANQLQAWTERGMLPNVEELEEKHEMIEDALEETPTDELDPETGEFDERMMDVVDYANELLMHLSNLKEARETVDSANERISHFEEEFDPLRR